MSSFENHCKESINLFGQPYEEVHLWLDEFQGTPEYSLIGRPVAADDRGYAKLSAPGFSGW
ncbi:MAG: hypothetical protein ABSA04_00515 [Desulfobaccales bacterium]